MNTPKGRILARIVADELTQEELEQASGGWRFPTPQPKQPSSSSTNTSTQKRNDPWQPNPDEDGGADDY
jgi:hypothetical protein